MEKYFEHFIFYTIDEHYWFFLGYSKVPECRRKRAQGISCKENALKVFLVTLP